MALAVAGVGLEAAPESQVSLCLYRQLCFAREASWLTWGSNALGSGGSRPIEVPPG